NTNIINPFQKISPDKQPYTTPQEKQQNTQQQLYLNCCYTKNALVKMCVMPVFLQGKQAFL
ncbi:MAG: hypothetical protein FWF27_04985, partial [Candidatus Bathyarchaeota archaeon]|nr:hypothetical protein [Candidatus Termiticorpusculum sp.]